MLVHPTLVIPYPTSVRVMLSLRNVLMISVISVLLLCGLGSARAGTTAALSTPPSALAPLSDDELRSFGAALLEQVYSVHARIAASANDGMPTVDTVDREVLQQIKELYDDDALIQRSRLNHALTKATFFPHFIDRFTLSDVVVTRAGDSALVLTYNIALPNRTTLRAGVVMSGESRPRIIVMRWRKETGMWKIFSYADFDLPKAMLCDADPSYVSQKSVFRPQDVALAKELSSKIQQASLDGRESSVQSDGFQYVFASGERKTDHGPVRTKIKKRYQPKNLEAIQSGDLFVMRSDTDDPTLTIDGEGVVPEMRPGMTTFLRDADGQWRMIAIGIFAITARVAEGTPCEKVPAQ